MEQTFTNLTASSFPQRKVYVISDVKEASEEFIAGRNIGGILCCTDTDAVRIIGRLKLTGFRFPGDLALVNYGNTELTGYFNPAITVIDCQYAEMAAQTASLIDRRNNASPLEQFVILPRLLVRET
jgi:DNA-binding LacI/PurR family transcriptional regulator